MPAPNAKCLADARCRCPVDDEFVRPFGGRWVAVGGSQLSVARGRDTVCMRIPFCLGDHGWDIDLEGKQSHASV
jgi:hypothetical protein